MGPRQTGIVCASSLLERSSREAIDLQAMELTNARPAGAALALQRSTDSGHAVELDRPQVGGTY